MVDVAGVVVDVVPASVVGSATDASLGSRADEVGGPVGDGAVDSDVAVSDERVQPATPATATTANVIATALVRAGTNSRLEWFMCLPFGPSALGKRTL